MNVAAPARPRAKRVEAHYNPLMSHPAMQSAPRPLLEWAHASLARLLGDDAGPFDWQALRVEASHRRFYRLRPTRSTVTSSYVVMSSPPRLENNSQFVVLAVLLRDHGIGVPQLLDQDEAAGYFLMSDLGDTHFEDVYAQAGPDRVLPAALDTLHALQQVRSPAIPAYTRERFQDELEIYCDWFLEQLLGVAADGALREVFAELIAATEAQPSCCVHRDFHSRNLLLTPAGSIGVVDFQDALLGPATYDLASLLRDCYYEFPEAEVAHWRDAYLATTPLPVARDRFAVDLDLTALQRQLKAVGIFVRLCLRDGRTTHLDHVVPVLKRIAALAARYPQTAALANHVATVLPRATQRLEALA